MDWSEQAALAELFPYRPPEDGRRLEDAVRDELGSLDPSAFPDTGPDGPAALWQQAVAAASHAYEMACQRGQQSRGGSSSLSAYWAARGALGKPLRMIVRSLKPERPNKTCAAPESPLAEIELRRRDNIRDNERRLRELGLL